MTWASRARQVAGGLAFAMAWLLGTADPAAAHSANNSPSSNYWAFVERIDPVTKRFDLNVIEATSRIELTWLSGPEVLVPGYDDEPYLRVGPRGVYENQAAPTTYVNRDRRGSTPIPADADSTTPPRWKRISPAGTARWHDHRVHWMGATKPPVVERAPDRRHVIQQWTVPVRQGRTTHLVRGRLEWRPGPSQWPYLACAAVIAGGLLLAGRTARARSRAGAKPIRRTIAAAALVLTAIDIGHLYAIAWGVHGGGTWGRFLGIGYPSLAATAVALVGAALLFTGRSDGFYLTAFAALIAFGSGGVADINILSRSATVAALSVQTIRVLVTATIGLGLGVGIASVVCANAANRARSDA